MENRQIDHPDALHEQQHLLETCAVIENEIDRLELETGVGAEEEREVRTARWMSGSRRISSA